MNESSPDLLIRALDAYVKVVSDPDVAGPDAVRLVAEAKDAGQPEALIAAMRAEAWYHRTRLEEDRAKALLDEAARLARRHRLSARLGEVLVTRGAVNHELGRPRAAQRDFDSASRLIDPAMAAELAAQQATLYQNMGRLGEAARLYRRSLSDPGLPATVRTKIANNLAMIEVQRGRPQTALRLLETAAAAAAEVGPAYVALVTESRAWATMQAGRLTEGLVLFDEAATLWKRAGLPLGELHAEQADLLVDLRLLPEAREHARLAFELLERQSVPLMAAEAQLRAATLALLMGDTTPAARLADRAALRFREQRRSTWTARAQLVAVEARLVAADSDGTDVATARRAAATLERSGMPFAAVHAHLLAGRLAATLGRTATAAASWEHAQALVRNAPVLVRLRGRAAGALRGQLAGDDRNVLRHSRAGLTDLARHRAALASHELRVLASGQGVELGRLGLAALVRTGSPTQVLDWMERTRAAALAAVEPLDSAGIEDDLASLRQLRGEIGEAQWTRGGEPAQLLTRQAELESRIRYASWTRGGSASSRRQPPSTAGLRGLLDHDLLVEYDVLDDMLVAVVVEPRRTRLVSLGPVAPVRLEIGYLLFALRRLAWRRMTPAGVAIARRTADAGLRRLARLLIEPLRLPDHAGLVVVPVGDLQRVPWSALHHRPVSMSPSASVWQQSMRQRRSFDDGGTVVLVAGPGVPGGAREVELLARLYSRASILVPPDSTAESVTAALAEVQLAHLACHGRIRADNPMFSSLLLSDGPLTMHEIELRGPAPHRIVLAACESGSEVAFEGNETLGFVTSLLSRGTAGLVASALLVPDWDVLPLMRLLHHEIRRGATLAAALHAARGSLDRRDPLSFVSWCAFNAFGAA